MDKYPAETDELMPVHVRTDVGNTDILTGVQVAILPLGARGPVWLPALEFGGVLHVRVFGLQRGTHRVWIRVTAGTETVVMFAGEFLVI